MTETPEAGRRRRCSNLAAAYLGLETRIIFEGKDWSGVEPPPAKENPSTISILALEDGTRERTWRTKLSARCFNSCVDVRIMRCAGISSQAERRYALSVTSSAAMVS